MSWLNTASITNLAKSALKEAQKTIDKALDIKENVSDNIPASSGREIDGFFESFGLGNEDECTPDSDLTTNVVINEPCSGADSTKRSEQSLDLVNSSEQAFMGKDEKINKISSSEDPDPEIPPSFEESMLLLETPERIRESYHIQNSVGYGEEENSCSESIHSSVSASSSVTVISPDNEIVTDTGSNSEGDARSICFLEAEVKLGEVTNMLTEAMRDSLKTENSASVSGDEIETATSSDIEIISSPQTRFRKTKTDDQDAKTHHRQSSEASSDGSIIGSLEIDKMARKISEMNQLLEARENKILEVSRNNAKLTEENENLVSQLSSNEKENLKNSEISRRQIEEFSLRLSSIEKRYQQAVAEKETQAKLLDNMKFNQNLAEQLIEKETIISELRQEGEKLSKQQLQHSNIIKKLRKKENDDDHLIKQLKENNEELNKELDRLKKSLSAKEELERNQIEAVRQLTAANSVLEKEMIAIKVVNRDCLTENEALKVSIEHLRKELKQLQSDAIERNHEEIERNLSTEVSLRQKMQLEFDSCTRSYEEEKLTLILRCDELVNTLGVADNDHRREREQMKNEMSGMMRRLQEAEARSDELSQALTSATRPLLRQIENLQQSLSNQRAMEEKSEKIFEDKLSDIKRQLNVSIDKETSAREMCLSLQSRISELTESINLITQQKDLATSEKLEEKLKRKQFEENVTKELKQDLKNLQENYRILNNELEMKSVLLEEETKRSALLEERLNKRVLNCTNPPQLETAHTEIKGYKIMETEAAVSRGSSPTPSLGKISLTGSLSESHTSNPWVPTDEVFEAGLATPVPKSSLYDALRAGSYAAVFESLQSQLKTRDGEIQQLQQELHHQEKNRDSLTKELTKLVQSNEELNRRVTEFEGISKHLSDLKTKYNALLQMYGEKIEENDELKLDLIDVKEMYKAQIDQLLKTE